jgi:hypothetical protein
MQPFDCSAAGDSLLHLFFIPSKRMTQKTTSSLPFLIVSLALLGIVGCGGGGEHGVASVAGTVTMDGKPVPDLVVTFTPQAAAGAANPGKSATGRTDAEGKFTMSTYEMGDGAIVGKHQVMVGLDGPNPTPPGKLPDNFVLEVKPGSNNFEIKLTP